MRIEDSCEGRMVFYTLSCHKGGTDRFLQDRAAQCKEHSRLSGFQKLACYEYEEFITIRRCRRQ